MKSRRVRLFLALVASVCALLAVLGNTHHTPAPGHHAADDVALTAVAHATPQVAPRPTDTKTGQLFVLALLLGLVAARPTTAWRSVARTHTQPRLARLLGRTVPRRGPPVLSLAQ